MQLLTQVEEKRVKNNVKNESTLTNITKEPVVFGLLLHLIKADGNASDRHVLALCFRAISSV